MANQKQAFVDDLYLETAKIEITRVKLFIGVMTISLTNLIIFYNFFPDQMLGFVTDIESFRIMILLISTFIAFEVGMFLFLNRSIKKKRWVNPKLFYISSPIESCFPMIALLAMYSLEGDLNILDTPVFYIGILIVWLSSLHLDPKISILSGLAPLLLYLAFFIPIHLEKPAEFWDSRGIPTAMYYIRAVLYPISGALAAFIARQIHQRILISFEHMEEKNKVERLFGQQVSQEIVDALKDGAESKNEIEATVMFLDIRDFSRMTGAKSPAEVIAFQNKVFDPLIRIVSAHGGIINQILGDGFMATFGVPSGEGDHVSAGFQAGKQILAEMDRLAAAGFIPETRVGIGLHSGKVITGNIGNEIRQQYSVGGRTVIFAARLEQLNKEFGSQFVVSEEVFSRMGGAAKGELREGVKVKGWEEPVKVFVVS